MQDRLFSSQSKLWQVDRELVLLLGGGRALLMQLAHPKVAAGVAQHSNFSADPLGRLYRTMSAMWSIVFDRSDSARAALERIRHVHEAVRGTVSAGEPCHAGMGYDALEQELLLWVHATLIDSALAVYQVFVKPLHLEERSRYYEDSKQLAQAFEIGDATVPGSLPEFNAYMKTMLAGPAVAVGPTAKSLARDILYPRLWLLRPAGPLFRLLTAGLMPETLRQGYEMNWNNRRATAFRLAAAAVRGLLPLMPPLLRIVPNARRAERQLRLALPR